jgi:superoxide dismutase, Fe-Mn family
MESYPFTLKKLNYQYDAIEPAVSAKTMKIHHQKHHKSYIDKLNETVKNSNFLKELPIDQLISKVTLEKVNEETAEKLRNFGGGHFNHIMFFDFLSNSGSKPEKMLHDLIKRDFGDFKTFEDAFKQKSNEHFGSGWCWLVLSKDKLKIQTTKNQDNPINFEKCTPIAGIDIWEHAYYLDYQNRKKDYIEEVFKKIDWKKADNKILENEYVK